MNDASVRVPDPGTTAWHAMSAGDVLARLGADRIQGLDTAQVQDRRAVFGANELPHRPPRHPLVMFLAQFRSPLIYLLFAAAVLATIFGELRDAMVIVAVLVLNAAIGALQEGRADRSLRTLQGEIGEHARVLRDGQEARVAAGDLVPGDVLLLEAGEAVAADARLVEAVALQVAEAALTGESAPVAKRTATLDARVPLAERANMVHAGTQVTAGHARAVVVATGRHSELGRIATLAGTARPPQTPIEQRIARLGRTVMLAAAVLFVLVFGVGLMRHLALPHIVMLAISQLVGMVPEGLPVAVTVALAVGVRRMARRQAVIRRLTAVETLGATRVICTDKTGTLTRNEMSSVAVWLPDGHEYAVEGTGYAPQGRFLLDGQVVDPSRRHALRALLEAVALCNDAHLLAPDGERDAWSAMGDPTEAALLTLARRGGIDIDALGRHWVRRGEWPFDPSRRMMATDHHAGGHTRIVIKGAPEVVLALCGSVAGEEAGLPLDAARRRTVQAALESMTGRALRVLAVAEVRDRPLGEDEASAAWRGKACLLGLVGQIDPPREGVAESIAQCRQAGIRTVMVTGDHARTGLSIARQLGMADAGSEAMEGRELERLDNAQLAARLPRTAVFARVEPAQKLRIVERLQAGGEVVAMTGDGVNDAPALRRADVGVAMGRSGTAVAREAAGMVITDDNFVSIVAAVREGRVVHRNIRKAVVLLFAGSVAEVAVLLLAMLVGYPPPFAAVQILWNNLVTEGVITVNLIMEPAEGDEMQRPPLPRRAPLLDRSALLRMVLLAVTMVVVSLGWFIWREESGVALLQARSETFTLLAMCEWFAVLGVRSARRPAWKTGLRRNPWLLGGLLAGVALQAAVVFVPVLNGLFHTTPIGAAAMGLMVACAAAVLLADEAFKWLRRRRGARA